MLRPAESFPTNTEWRGGELGAEIVHLGGEERLIADYTCRGTTISLEGSTYFHDSVFQTCHIKSQGGFTHEFLRCRFAGCDFTEGTYERAVFVDCTFDRCGFGPGTKFRQLRIVGTRGLETCIGLESIEIDEYPLYRGSFADDLAEAPLPIVYRHATWATLRGFGSLPFFGFSYGGTAAILLLLSIIDSYNTQVRNLHAWAAEGDRAEPLVGLVSRLHAITLNWQTPALLTAAVLLIIASTIYAMACPPRVKEFSLERWTTEFGKNAVNYVPFTWRHPCWRWPCFACFVLGSAITAVVLIARLGVATGQILRNFT